mgnify:FL=1
MESQLGKLLIVAGAALVLIGALFVFGDKIPFIGKMPGDLSWEGKNFKVYFPLGTMLVISVVLTIILNLFWRR